MPQAERDVFYDGYRQPFGLPALPHLSARGQAFETRRLRGDLFACSPSIIGHAGDTPHDARAVLGQLVRVGTGSRREGRVRIAVRRTPAFTLLLRETRQDAPPADGCLFVGVRRAGQGRGMGQERQGLTPSDSQQIVSTEPRLTLAHL